MLPRRSTRSRSRERNSRRYRSDTKRRRSYSFEDDAIGVRKKRFVRNNNFFCKYEHDERNYYDHSQNYHFRQSHHHHYHNHTHYYPSVYNRHSYHSRSNKNKHVSTTLSSGISADNGSETKQKNNDLEGTVNLKNVTSIYRKRYDIGKKLGQGTFGLVIECIDNKRNIRVAVKIVRSVKRYLDAAEIEIEILNKLDELDVLKNSLIIRLYKSFRCIINGVQHSCLVFEKCGKSLYDYVKKNKYEGFPLSAVAMIGYQLIHSISFCHLNKLTHTDLKLENILFVSDEYVRDRRSKLYLPRNSFEIRLIDFGGATFESDHHSSIINTRQYRGPEVILHLSWSYPSDVWSIGCILAELYCGELLFATHDDTEHLHLMKKMLNVDDFPKNMINAQNAQMFKWPTSNSSETSNTAKSIKYIEKCKTLNQMIADDHLFDLINKCLQIDPNRRITALQARNHPFFLQFRQNPEFNKIYNSINHHR